MMLEISAVTSKQDLRKFVGMPFSLYQHEPLWVPPIKKQDIHLLSIDHHPFWKTASRKLFLAYEHGQPIGRIAAIVDEKYNNYAQEKCGVFGFFECANNPRAASGLLDAARSWLRDQDMQFMRGPLNPSTNYTCGLLVQGFEHPPALMMPWNPPFYASLLERWGLYKEEDLFAWIVKKDKLSMSPKIAREIERLQLQSNFTFRPASKKTMTSDIRDMLELYRLSWAENWAFSPLSEGEADELVKELKGIIDPDYFVLFFHNKKAVAGMVALPDLTPLLRKLGGKMGLTAPWHYFRTKNAIQKSLRIMLFGILPEYRLQGLPLLLLNYMFEQARKSRHLEWVEGSWILERNLAMNDLMQDFSATIAKRYRIYRREIGPC